MPMEGSKNRSISSANKNHLNSEVTCIFIATNRIANEKLQFSKLFSRLVTILGMSIKTFAGNRSA